MKFQEFVGAAEVHLRMAGWLMHGHNGVWRKYKKAGVSDVQPLPAALIKELETDGAFEPTVEAYLTNNGWRRSSSGVSGGWPMFSKNGKFRNLPIAMLQQLRDDRIDRAAVVPPTTPSEMKNLLDVRAVRNSPPPSGTADTAISRR
jgi:hypothetical protein